MGMGYLKYFDRIPKIFSGIKKRFTENPFGCTLSSDGLMTNHMNRKLKNFAPVLFVELNIKNGGTDKKWN